MKTITLEIDPSDLDIVKIKARIIQLAFDSYPKASIGLMAKKLNMGAKPLFYFCKKHGIKTNYESGGRHIKKELTT